MMDDNRDNKAHPLCGGGIVDDVDDVDTTSFSQ
jgi:hypothetical protein